MKRFIARWRDHCDRWDQHPDNPRIMGILGERASPQDGDSRWDQWDRDSFPVPFAFEETGTAIESGTGQDIDGAQVLELLVPLVPLVTEKNILQEIHPFNDIGRMAEWLSRIQPEDLPAAPFALKPEIKVMNAAGWLNALKTDASQGKDGPRVRTGAFQEDCRFLNALLPSLKQIT